MRKVKKPVIKYHFILSNVTFSALGVLPMRNLFKVATIAATIMLASCASTQSATDTTATPEQPKVEATAAQNHCMESCKQNCMKHHKHHHHHAKAKAAPAAAAPAAAPAATDTSTDTSTDKTE
jgi:hypothetical protein